MKIFRIDLKKGVVRVMPESLDDLWHLYNIILEKDEIYARTTRQVKTEDEYARPAKAKRIPVSLGVKVEKTYWDRLLDRLRVRGIVCKAPEKLNITGSRHTIDVIVNNAVTVEKNLYLKKGVNFATGNVDFPGDIVIAGDVQGGFSVKSTGKIEIHGVIEDAEIEADGDVLVKAGFTGSGKGKIYSKGDVFIKFIDNQTIEADGSIHIGDSCVQANVTAGKNIEVSTGAGIIVGGHVKAKGEIIAKVLGNQKNTKTVVEVCASGGEYQAKLKAKEEAIQIQKEKMSEVGTIMRKIQQARAEKADDDPILLGKVRVCQDKLHALEDALNKMEEDLNKFSKKGDCSGQVQVLKDAYPGVEFIMGGISRKVLEVIGKATFVREGEEIIDALSKAKQQDD